VSIDYAAQEAERFQLTVGPAGAAIDGGKLDVVSAQPLQLELEDFVDAVRTRRPPRVTGLAGRRALALAHRITTIMGSGIFPGGATR